MPYRSGYLGKHRHRGRSRRHASGVIGRAWRKRKARRSGGLVARTALSNRKQIKKLNRGIETKMIEAASCTIANQFSGQAFVRQQVDVNGVEGTGVTPLVFKPFRGLVNGTTSSTITG